MDFSRTRSTKNTERLESTPHVTREVSGTIADQIGIQCDALARRELVSSFGFNPASLPQFGPLIDNVSTKIVEKIAGGSWCNGTPLTILVRHELFIALGGDEYVQEKIVDILTGMSYKPPLQLRSFSDTVSRAVVRKFIADTSVRPSSLSDLVRENVHEALTNEPGIGLPVTGGTNDVTVAHPNPDLGAFKDIRERTRKRVTVLSESPDAQLQRCENLLNAHETMKCFQTAKDAALDLVRSMLSSHFPPEMFNTTSLDNLGLSVMQMNDVAVNFLFWAIDASPKLTKNHTMVVYLMMFKGMDVAQVEETMKIYGQKDNVDCGLIAKKTASLYAEVQNVFARDGVSLFDTYLEKCNPKDNSNRACIPNYNKVARSIRSFIDGTDARGKGASGIASTYRRNIEIPSTEYDKTIEEVDVVLLQHGNLTARNRTMVRLLRMIGQCAYGAFGKYWTNHMGSTDDCDDILQGIAEIVMSKLVKFNPSKARITTYMNWWINQAAARYITDNVLVSNSVHTNEILLYMLRHPEMSDKEIAHERKTYVPTVQRIRRAASPRNRIVWSDEPISNDSDDGNTVRGDFIPELHTENETQYKAFQEGVTRTLVKTIMATLPPRDTLILRERIMNGRTLESIGEELGLTRERVRQVEEGILNSITPHTTDTMSGAEDVKSQYDMKSQHFILVSDSNKFAQWLNTHFDDVEKQVVSLWLGVDDTEKVARRSFKTIISSLAAGGFTVSQKRVSRIVKKAKNLLAESQLETGLQIVSKKDAYAQVRKLLEQAG